MEVDDVLTEARQAEIEDVVRQLAALSPTHVAIEWPSHMQEALDARYDAYREGDHALERGEGEQIGFRLAAAAGLDRVYGVDWNGASPGDRALYDWPAYGNAHGQGARVAALTDPARAVKVPTLDGRTVTCMLLDLNAPEQIAALHRSYFDIASIGDDEAQPGASWVGHWYARNLRIFNQLVALAESSDDRVVVIYGVGHAHLLNQFAEESGAFERLDVAEVLTAAD